MDAAKFDSAAELAGAIILSLATLCTAWCGYQSALWSTTSSLKMENANLLNMRATENTLAINQQLMADGIVVMNFVNATFENKKVLIDYYLTHTRPQISDMLSLWYESDPLKNPSFYKHPMDLPEFKAIAEKGSEESAKLRKEADSSRTEALQADDTSGAYLILTVLFSAVMFLCGIESRFRRMYIRMALLSASGILCLYSVFRLILLPLAS